jgi:excisionase family DNA binding protein
MSHDPVLTAHQVADEMGIHVKTLLRAHVRPGHLKAAKLGGRWFIRRSWFDEYLKPAQPEHVA